jgi:hypothetical protein
LTPGLPDAAPPPSDRRPGLPLDPRSPTRRSAASTTSRVPLRRKRPAGTQGSGDIDEPSAVTERARSIGDHATSEIDAPGPCLTPTCGGPLRRPRTEEWPLPDHHPRSRSQLGALDPRSPITEEGSGVLSLRQNAQLGRSLCLGRWQPEWRRNRPFRAPHPNQQHRPPARFGPFSGSQGPLSPTQPNQGHFGTDVEIVQIQ